MHQCELSAILNSEQEEPEQLQWQESGKYKTSLAEKVNHQKSILPYLLLWKIFSYLPVYCISN